MDTLTFQTLVALRDGPADGNSVLAQVNAAIPTATMPTRTAPRAVSLGFTLV